MFYHVLALGLVVAKPTAERPNFVVIVTDSFDGRVVENKSYKPIVDLKNIEKLQDQGTTYQRTYCDYPICCPSRTALLSGRRNDITHAWNNHEGLDPNFRNWTTDFRENGYKMALYGKMDDQTGSHTESERVESWTRNVDFALRQDPRPIAQTTGDMNTRRVNKKDWNNFDRAKAFLDSNSNQTEPFFLYWGIYSPHPYDTIWEDGPQAGASTFLSSPHYLSRIRQNQIRLPKWNDFENEHPVDKYAIVTKNCSGEFERDEVMAVRKHYYAMLAEVDEMIGDIVQAIPQARVSVL